MGWTVHRLVQAVGCVDDGLNPVFQIGAIPDRWRPREPCQITLSGVSVVGDGPEVENRVGTQRGNLIVRQIR